jgi:hypothetical protein
VTKEYIISSGLLELHALGHTTEEETKQVLQAYINWPDVKEDVLSMEKTMEAYAVSNGVNASANVKNELFKNLNITTTYVEKRLVPNFDNRTLAQIIHRNFKFVRNIAAVACVLLFISTSFLVVNYAKYRNVAGELEVMEQKMAALNNASSETVSEMKIVQSKFSLPLKLKPDIAPKDADAKIYWLTNTGEIYIDPTNLPTAPQGKQYQLWAIVDGKAVDAGLIVSGKDKKLHFQQMKTFGKAQAFAVTLEVEGGVVASKEKPYVIVSL